MTRWPGAALLARFAIIPGGVCGVVVIGGRALTLAAWTALRLGAVA